MTVGEKGHKDVMFGLVYLEIAYGSHISLKLTAVILQRVFAV